MSLSEQEKNRRKQANYRAKPKAVSRAKADRQEQFLTLIAEGHSRIDSVHLTPGITADNTIDQWIARDPGFRSRYEAAKAKAIGEFVPQDLPYDAEFVERYFGFSTPRHLQAIRDGILEVQEEARKDKEPKALLVLAPPDHAKSTEVENFLTHRIATDPNVRCLLVSKTQGAARKRTGRIQRRLTDRAMFADFVDSFGPFKSETHADARPWRADFFTVIGQNSGERDYTLEALGIGGQIYGARADIIILDDIADLGNQTPAEIDKQMEYIQVEVMSRLSEDGVMICIGTHMRERDVYTQLEELGLFDKVVKLPALSEDPHGNLQPLWPERYPLKRLMNLKEKRSPRLWELVYQQNPLPSVGAVFTQEAIEACYDRERWIGHVPEGSVVVAGVDPSTGIGFSAGVVIALKRHESGEWMRYLVDVWNESGLTGEGGDHQAGVVEFIVELCRRYRVRHLCVEDGAWMGLINNSFSLRSKLYELGVNHRAIKASDVTTGVDAISQLSGLFNHRLISIPASASSLQNDDLRTFHNQLLTYTGEKQHWRKLFDVLKAFRMAEWAVREFDKTRSSEGAEVIDIHRPMYMRGKKLVANV